MSLRNAAAELVKRLRNDTRAVAILAEWLGEGGQPVTFERAEKRAKTCTSGAGGGSKCPKNQPNFNRVENAVAARIIKMEEIRHSAQLRTSQDSNLHNCSVCTCNLKLKVWIPLKHLDDKPDKFPSFCWLRTERDEPQSPGGAAPVPPIGPVTVPVRPVVRVRREDAFGDVIQSSILATKLWKIGYDVWWRCSDATRSALLNHPHITGFITDKTAPVDVNLDDTYEKNLERHRKDIGTILLEAADHQLQKGGFLIPDKNNRVPVLALTEDEIEDMRGKLKHLEGRIVSFIPQSRYWPARTIDIDSVTGAAAQIEAHVIWAFPGDPPEGSKMHRIEIRGFRQLMALIALSDVVATPDTGPLHVAVAFNRPIVVIEQNIDITLRLTTQSDWTAVHAPVGCIRCGDFTCKLDMNKPPCQKVPPELIAAAVNRKLEALEDGSVSVIIPVYKRHSRLVRCLEAVSAQPDVSEIIVALDGDATLEGEGFRVVKSPGTRTGYGKTCMRGAHASTGQFLLMLNDDCYLKPGALRAMLDTMQRGPMIGVVGAQLWYPDGTIQHGGTTRIKGGVGFGHVDWKSRTPSLAGERDMEFVTFACALVRRSAFYAVRGFDEDFDCYCEDSDFCLKVKQAGFRVVYNANAQAIHDESQTTAPMKGDLASSADRVFRKKWDWYFQHNPVE